MIRKRKIKRNKVYNFPKINYTFGKVYRLPTFRYKVYRLPKFKLYRFSKLGKPIRYKIPKYRVYRLPKFGYNVFHLPRFKLYKKYRPPKGKKHIGAVIKYHPVRAGRLKFQSKKYLYEVHSVIKWKHAGTFRYQFYYGSNSKQRYENLKRYIRKKLHHEHFASDFEIIYLEVGGVHY